MVHRFSQTSPHVLRKHPPPPSHTFTSLRFGGTEGDVAVVLIKTCDHVPSSAEQGQGRGKTSYVFPDESLVTVWVTLWVWILQTYPFSLFHPSQWLREQLRLQGDIGKMRLVKGPMKAHHLIEDAASPQDEAAWVPLRRTEKPRANRYIGRLRRSSERTKVKPRKSIGTGRVTDSKTLPPLWIHIYRT